MNVKELFGWWLSKILYESNPFKKARSKLFYSQFIQKDDLCFDVGAHLGDRSSAWVTLGAKVVGIEPQPKFSAYLAKKFKDADNYINEQVGVGPEEATATMYISSLFPTLSTLSSKEWRQQINDATPLTISYDQTITIDVTTLDNLIIKYGLPSFIKIDVEGYESEVLKGLNHKIKCLSFEVLNLKDNVLENCLEKLVALNYTKFNYSKQETFKMSFDDWVDADTVKQYIYGFGDKLVSGDIYASI